MSEFKTIQANSRDGGEVYRLLNMIHQMAGMLANSSDKTFNLAETQSNPVYGPIVTVWANGIVDIRASSRGSYHEYSMTRCVKEES